MSHFLFSAFCYLKRLHFNIVIIYFLHVFCSTMLKNVLQSEPYYSVVLLLDLHFDALSFNFQYLLN